MAWSVYVFFCLAYLVVLLMLYKWLPGEFPVLFISYSAHVSGRRHKKRVASRRKAERDLVNTLTVYKQRLLDEHTAGLQADDSNAQSADDLTDLDTCTDAAGNSLKCTLWFSCGVYQVFILVDQNPTIRIMLMLRSAVICVGLCWFIYAGFCWIYEKFSVIINFFEKSCLAWKFIGPLYLARKFIVHRLLPLGAIHEVDCLKFLTAWNSQ